MDPRDYDYYDAYCTEDYDWNSDMNYNEQMWADRSDYADELYERDEIDSVQRSEIKAGA